METDLGKLFIGGISWDTDENRLREYFGQFGKIVEAVIMRDRITGRARGFGFVVFVDPVDAEKVLREKHMIDGRTVEAKKAVPREDQHILARNINGIQGSPRAGGTKKIFVGGLASTVTESDFKQYFDQFGTITDVVVMYDHNTKRPRGFGFITYDSEDAVDRVLYKHFHELNGKMVEVKRAVPKELSPSPSRSPLVGYSNYGLGLGRSSNFIGSFPQGYNFSPVGGYDRFNSVAGGRSAFPPFGPAGYRMNMNMNMDQGFSANYGNNSSFGNSPGRLLSPYISPIEYNGSNSRNESLFSSASSNVWGNGSFNNPSNPTSPPPLMGSRSGNSGASLATNAAAWDSSPVTSQAGRNIGYGFSDGGYALGGVGYGRNTGSNTTITSSFGASTGLGSSYGELYQGSLVHGDSTWGAPELEDSSSLGFGFGNIGSDVTYGVTNRKADRGVVA